MSSLAEARPSGEDRGEEISTEKFGRSPLLTKVTLKRLGVLHISYGHKRCPFRC